MAQARAALGAAPGPQQAAAANDRVGTAVNRLLAVSEAYPQLRASENFVKLQDELTDTEDKIAAARRYYNATVYRLNTRVDTFPWLLIARTFGFRRREFFGAEGDERAPVAVSLGQT